MSASQTTPDPTLVLPLRAKESMSPQDFYDTG
jgi:hypothetical protein